MSVPHNTWNHPLSQHASDPSTPLVSARATVRQYRTTYDAIRYLSPSTHLPAARASARATRWQGLTTHGIIRDLSTRLIDTPPRCPCHGHPRAQRRSLLARRGPRKCSTCCSYAAASWESARRCLSTAPCAEHTLSNTRYLQHDHMLMCRCITGICQTPSQYCTSQRTHAISVRSCAYVPLHHSDL
eukprot:2006830-Rhodomonas_salina.4